MKRRSCDFDIIVVGAGHAGIEACLASSRLGLRTLLVTSNKDRIGYMSCNPSIGGLAKGHMVREIDVLGGEMGLAADKTCIQFKRLNSSKGPAVRGSRVQSDKFRYAKYMSDVLEKQANLVIKEVEVRRLILNQNQCYGVVLEDDVEIYAKATILTTGTFLNGIMHIGLRQIKGGRSGDISSRGLSDQLAEKGFSVKRLKTGTPPRLHKDSIDWSKTVPQKGDEKFYPFSFRSNKEYILPQISCFLSHTTERTHEIIRKNLDKSPMFCGIIEGLGPRYCPSIEDKVTRFAERSSHQTFLEPEGLDTNLIYLQGISTSLPEEIQREFVRTIVGLENAEIISPGYAVEYDYVEPTQIWHRLETRSVKQLFLAGQINGTSGYEEAAAQGIIAGINASHSVLNKAEVVLGRDQAYAGVLVDDLVTKGAKEPYRMFTSRAEHRLVLREDNTIDRLGELARSIGLISDAQQKKLDETYSGRKKLLKRLGETKIFPKADIQEKIERIGSTKLQKVLTFEEFLRRPEISVLSLPILGFEINENPDIYESIEVEIKYSGYIKRQMELINQMKRFEEMLLGAEINYENIKGLSKEEIEKLNRIKPRTLGQASRISGVNPSGIQAIMIYMKGKNSCSRGSI